MWVYFPYSYIYPEQYDYMLNLKRALDARGPCAIEMPTGTGKTVSLLSLSLSWILARRGGMTDHQRKFEEMPTVNGSDPGAATANSSFRLIYCCRTLGEIDKTVAELKQVWSNIEAQMELDEQEANKEEIPKENKKTNNRSKLLALCLSSRKRMCINPKINHFASRIVVDSQCRDMTAPHVRERAMRSQDVELALDAPEMSPLCEFYEGYEAYGKDMILSGIYSFDELSELGSEHGVCPYFLSRRLLPLADVIIYSYQYLLNPRISDMISQQLKSDCIVIFDEAHNIDNVCIDALSVEINRSTVHRAQANIRKLSNELGRVTETGQQRLQNEYQNLLRGLEQFTKGKSISSSLQSDFNKPSPTSIHHDLTNAHKSKTTRREDEVENPTEEGQTSDAPAQPSESTSARPPSSSLNSDPPSEIERIFDSSVDQIRVNPVLSPEVARAAIPQSLLDAKTFLQILDLIIGHLRNKMKLKQVIQEKPPSFLKHVVAAIMGVSPDLVDPNTGIPTGMVFEGINKHNDPSKYIVVTPQTLQFLSRRLISLMSTLEITGSEMFTPIGVICDLISLASAYASEGFLVLMEPWDDRTPTISNPRLELACLDAQIAMKAVVSKFPRVVLTSGTLSPISMLPRIIGLQPVIATSLPMSLARNSVCPLIVTRGDDQTVLSTKFQLRSQPDVVRNYAQLLLSMAQIVPDGIVCFFPSYLYLEMVVSMWHEMGMLHKLIQYKLIFVETEDLLETQVALANYRRACNSGRGAVFLSVARGKVSEGVDFDHHYGRCVILFGIPFLYTESRVLKARLEFIRRNFNIPENDFLAFDAMRMASQCVGRVVRGKTDYGIMIFADKRYARSDKRNKMPPWISQFVAPQQMNLTTQGAITIAKQFLLSMAQPFTRESQLGTSLWSTIEISKQPTSDPSNYDFVTPPRLSMIPSPSRNPPPSSIRKRNTEREEINEFLRNNPSAMDVSDFSLPPAESGN